MSDEQPCAGFPDQCPNTRPVAPNWPSHGGGIRCGCGDLPHFNGVISPAELSNVTISATQLESSTMSFLAANGKPIVTIRPDGRLEFGDDYEPGEAARVFWAAVQRFAPTGMEKAYGKPLTASINAQLAAGERAEAALRAILSASDRPTHCHDQPAVWDGGGPCVYCTAIQHAQSITPVQEVQP